ncbi:MAG: dimethyladenosine transferase [Actinomycetales bacterium]|nr:MAG: dimethyladenosine transferase [Actinomycetales bacterium]
MDNDTLSVERTIAAPASAIFAYLSDAAKHQEIDGSGTVRGTRGDSEPLSIGSVFGMAMHMGVGYRTKNTVIELVPDQRIAWQTTGLGGLVGGRIWRYELEPAGEGSTLVRETWDVSRDKQKFFLKRSKIPAANQAGMRRTLERIAGLVER